MGFCADETNVLSWDNGVELGATMWLARWLVLIKFSWFHLGSLYLQEVLQTRNLVEKAHCSKAYG